MVLIDNEPRSATALAATDVELVAVSEKQFLFLIGQTPYFALKVMRVLARHQQDLRLIPSPCEGTARLYLALRYPVSHTERRPACHSRR
jgi:CRP-like cAMP-binding protein